MDRKFCVRAGISLLLFFCCGTVFAQESPGDLPARQSFDPWSYNSRFGHYGLEAGVARQIRLNGAQASDVTLFSFRPQYIIRLYDFSGLPVLRRLELVNEGALIASLAPRTAGIYGANEIIRFDLKPMGREKRLIVYFDAGAGINRFDLRVPELTGKFQFSLQVGVGFKYRPSKKRVAYGCQIAVDHFSNAGIRRPNQGINSLRLSCGIDILPKH